MWATIRVFVVVDALLNFWGRMSIDMICFAVIMLSGDDSARDPQRGSYRANATVSQPQIVRVSDSRRHVQERAVRETLS